MVVSSENLKCQGSVVEDRAGGHRVDMEKQGSQPAPGGVQGEGDGLCFQVKLGQQAGL